MPADAPDAAARRQVSSPDFIAGEILRGLYAGRYVPGQRLIEADLTREYKVSRGSIREALKRLAAEGTVALTLHRGAYIRALSRAEVAEVLALVEVLTGLAARLAAERIGLADNGARVAKALEDLAAAEAGGDAYPFARARDRFYRALVLAGGNRELARVLPTMQVHLVRTQFRPAEATGDNRLGDYRRVVAAVLSGDAAAAEAAMRQHIRAGSERIQRLPDEAFAPEP